MKNKTYLSSGGAFINGKYLNKQDATILISIISYHIDNYQMCNYTCQIQIHVSHKKKKKKIKYMLIGDTHLHVATSNKRRRRSWAYPMFGWREMKGKKKVANMY